MAKRIPDNPPEHRGMAHSPEAESALNEYESLFRSAVEHAPIGISLVGLDHRFLQVNDALCRILGFTAGELLQKKTEDVTHPDDPRLEEKHLPRLLDRTEQSCQIEKRLMHADGHTVWGQLSISLVQDREGNPLFFLGQLVDISSRKRIEEESARRQQLLVAINRIQEHFIASREEQEAFAGLLADLLAITESEHGFIGEVLFDGAGQPFLKSKAISDISWDASSRDFYEQYKSEGLEFRNLKTLTGVAITTRETVIANDPLHDPRSGGNLPEGHPEIDSFLGIPINYAGRLVAMVGLANRRGGYNRALVDFLQPLSNTIGQLVEARRNEAIHGRAVDALKKSEGKFRMLFEQSTDGLFILDMKGNFVDVNRTAYERLGYTKDEMLAMSVSVLDPPEFAARVPERLAQIREHGFAIFESAHLRKDGTAMPVEINARVMDFDGQRVFFSVIRDITERKVAERERERLEKQLVQAGKMEAVGRLAGGVAHDFNNILGAILGNAEAALMKTRPGNAIQAHLQEIIRATERSADFTRQLLAFARKQNISPQVLDINERVAGLLKILGRLIGEDIKLVWTPQPSPGLVRMDPAQVDQILVNLAVNARDAIEGVGTIYIRTEDVFLDNAFCQDREGLEPGRYVLLEVNDDGCGMTKEVVDQLFEPFFTTKETGKGTGLGLATIYGIVKQNDGYIGVHSEPAHGSTFQIYLPKVKGLEEVLPAETVTAPARGSETILVVEDEESILDISRKALEQTGYRVLAADSPRKALEMVAGYEGDIHLLLTDVIMPEMNGRDLSHKLAAIYPGMRILFMSGYADDVIADCGVLEPGVKLLQKPFSLAALGKAVREALDQE